MSGTPGIDLTFIATLAVAAATLIVAIMTWLSVKAVRRGLDAEFQPILIPTNVPDFKDLGSVLEEPIQISNLGRGVATDVWGVLFPESEPQISTVPQQFSLRLGIPFSSGDVRSVGFQTGGTQFTHKDKIGRYLMSVPPELAPEKGFPNTMDRRERVIARLTLSCRDALSHKHAGVFDIDQLGVWTSVATSFRVCSDVRDLDVGKGVRSPRKRPPSAKSTAPRTGLPPLT